MLHIGIAIIIGLLIVNFVVQRTVVDGSSMEPTLQDRDNLWVEKLSPRFGKLKHGDVVTCDVPDRVGEESSPLIKRIIAVGGDTIEIKDNKVYVNNKELQEDYILGDVTTCDNPEFQKLTVPEGYVYVMGDNRQNSKDSRMIGLINVKDEISGKAILRFWPLKSFGFIKR